MLLLLSRLGVDPKMKVGFATRITPRTIMTQKVALNTEIRVLLKIGLLLFSLATFYLIRQFKAYIPLGIFHAQYCDKKDIFEPQVSMPNQGNL